MRLPRFETTDRELSRFADFLRGILTRITVDNFDSILIDGITDPTADTIKIFKHGRGATPRMVDVLEGDVYIQSGTRGPEIIDVRSRFADQTFKLRLYF